MITAIDLLKNNNKTAKQLSFFNNYKKYTNCPCNFIWANDANCFNNYNVNKWINVIIDYINSKLNDNDIITYRYQNDIFINFNDKCSHVHEYLLPDNNKWINKYLFMTLINMSLKYNMHLLDSFIYLYLTDNNYIKMNPAGNDKIDKINNYINLIYTDINKFNLQIHFDNNILTNTIDRIDDIIAKDKKQIMLETPSELTEGNISKWLNKNDYDILCKRYINNSIVTINLYSILNNYTVNILYNRTYKIKSINNIVVKNIFYCLNNEQLFIKLMYNIFRTAQLFFNYDFELLLQLLIIDNDFSKSLKPNQILALKNFQQTLQRSIILHKYNNDKFKNNNRTTTKQNKISANLTYYIKRDEFNNNNKRTYKIVKKIDTYKNKQVDIFIMEQISGNRNGSKYILNKYDCKYLGIEYKPNLEVFSQHLDWVTDSK